MSKFFACKTSAKICLPLPTKNFRSDCYGVNRFGDKVVPIIIANPKPFRLVLRDESDHWMPNLDEVNSKNYDYIKLHRATVFFDADLKCKLPVCIGFDGSFILPASKDYSMIETALDDFNRIFASIFIGGLYVTSIAPKDLSHGEMHNEGYFRHTHTLGSRGDLYKALGNRDAGALDNIKLLNPPIVYRGEFTEAYSKGAVVFNKVNNLSPSLFISAFTYYLELQTREALTNSWICIEQILEHLWQEVMLPDVKAVNIQGRSKFMNSQQWTASHKIELLYQSEILTAETYSKLTDARLSRNKFIHIGKAPSHENACNALYALIELISACAEQGGFEFDKNVLIEYIKPKDKVPHSGFKVANAKEVDWTKVTHWKPVLPIPGDKYWEGEFEIFADITLESLP